MDDFLNLFNFDPQKSGLVGVEREFHLLDLTGRYAPIAQSILHGLADEQTYGYEWSACQLETRTRACHLENLKVELQFNEEQLKRKESLLGFRRSYYEVGDEDMPLDIFPDPYGRYERITSQRPRSHLQAACRVIGTHVHTGIKNAETAIKAYNALIPHLDELIKMGDHSNGMRIRLLTELYPHLRPQPYASIEHWYAEAKRLNYLSDPRLHWSLIRISVHGTIEVRTFGATEDLDEIVLWSRTIHEILEPFL